MQAVHTSHYNSLQEPAILKLLLNLEACQLSRQIYAAGGQSKFWMSGSIQCYQQCCLMKLFFFSFFFLFPRPRGLTFMWLRCYGLCQRRNPTEPAHSFIFCSCVCFCLYGPFNCISFRTVSRQLSSFLTLFLRPYLCLIDPFNYMSLKSPLQP